MFQFWHDKDSIAARTRDECCSNNGTSGSVKLNRQYLGRNQEVGESCQPSRIVPLDVRRSQRSVASYRQLQSNGIVANLKDRWEHRHDGHFKESVVRINSLSPPQDRRLHKPVRKSNSFSPPARRRQKNKLMLSVSNNSDLNQRVNSTKSSMQSRKKLEDDDCTSNSKVSLLTERIKPSLPTGLIIADNMAIIAQVFVYLLRFCPV